MGFFRSLGRALTRRPDAELVGALREQVAVTVEGVDLTLALVNGEVPIADARQRMREIEHRGDECRHTTVNRLSSAFANPIDREDLFRLSRSIDDVLDNLRDFVREWDLFDVSTKDPYIGLLDATARALEDLHGAVQIIGRDPKKLTSRTALATKKSANEIRRLYDEELAKLFQRKLSMKVLKIRELLRRLDVVGLRLNEAADVLADAAIKRRA